MIEPVISPAQLRRLLEPDANAAGDRRVVLADVRWALGGPPGAESFEAGHLPGAVFVDLDTDLAAPATPEGGRHPLPAPAAFAASMTALGIGEDATVVAYDDSSGSSAARLVWMLRVLGVDAALLDGGLRGWDGPLETGPSRPVPTPPVPTLPVPTLPPFPVRDWPADRLADADTTAAFAARGGLVLDARVAGRFSGEQPLAADPRPGHLPGARNAPWQDNLDDAGRFLPADALRTRYAAAFEEGAEAPIAYCGSGVTACLDLLALERAGLPGARLYPGSWSQYAADESRPVATGD